MRVIIYLTTVLLLTSCGKNYHDSISGNGKVSTKIIGYDTISRLIISDRLDAILIPSDSNKVVLKTDENLLDIIQCEIVDGTLIVSSKKLIRMARSKEVLIYGNSVSQIELSTLASVFNKDTINSKSLDMTLNTGSEARITGNFETFSLHVNTGGTVTLMGSTDYLTINASSAADVFAYDFEADEGNITSSSAADVRVSIKNRARLIASSLSDIKYRGNPSVLDSKATSLADIKRVKF